MTRRLCIGLLDDWPDELHVLGSIFVDISGHLGRSYETADLGSSITKDDAFADVGGVAALHVASVSSQEMSGAHDGKLDGNWIRLFSQSLRQSVRLVSSGTKTV